MAVPDGVTNVETLAAGGTSGSTSTTSGLTTVLPSTFGAQKTLVILVNFQDNATQPYTPDTARNIVFNATSNFDLENSFQQAWLTGDVYGWYTIALDSTVCDLQTNRELRQAGRDRGGGQSLRLHPLRLRLPGQRLRLVGFRDGRRQPLTSVDQREPGEGSGPRDGT